MTTTTRDLRVLAIRPLLPPAILQEEIPLSGPASDTVGRARERIIDILHGRDDRLVVVVGPCSIHDPGAALDYARRLLPLARELEGALCVVMRVYFEKPRTTIGWKGLINDPRLDGTYAINEGLRLARRLLVDLAELGVASGCEFLDPISPQFTSDVVAWAAIGARTTESQVHRELASGLSMPVGFKNGTGGSVQVAIDAVRSAAHPHAFLGVTEQGLGAIVQTSGNPEEAALVPRLMVDASHGNSGKDHRRQAEVACSIGDQVAAGQRGIFGVMLESFLVEGSQSVGRRDGLVYGQSVTDACMGWQATERVLRELAASVEARRRG
jgi:3-deoxy-7-phosphoheptulonate synthase